MEGPITSFSGFPPNSDKFENKKYVEDTVLSMLSQMHRDEIDGEPFVPGRFRESIWLRVRAGERSRQHMWSIINTLKVKGMELEGARLSGGQKKVQCTRAIKVAEALLLSAEPKSDFDYGKVCCKVASGKQILVAESTHDYEKFVWRIGGHQDGIGGGSYTGTLTRLWRGSTFCTGLREKCVFSHPGITFLTWNTCGSAGIDIALLPERMSQVSSWSFVAIQEYGKAQRDGAELGGHRLLYLPYAVPAPSSIGKSEYNTGVPGGLSTDCEGEGDNAETDVPWNGQLTWSLRGHVSL